MHCIWINVISVMISMIRMNILTKYVNWGFGILGNGISRAPPKIYVAI